MTAITIARIETYVCGIGDLLFIILYAYWMRGWYKSWTGRFLMSWPFATGLLFWAALLSEWVVPPMWFQVLIIGDIALIILWRLGMLAFVQRKKVARARREYEELVKGETDEVEEVPY